MVKAKFGDGLLSKTIDAQRAEALTKFVAHNRCCLIQAFYELGIETNFGAMAATAPAQRLAIGTEAC